jgi:potassium-dependent mechanosensitive channel
MPKKINCRTLYSAVIFAMVFVASLMIGSPAFAQTLGLTSLSPSPSPSPSPVLTTIAVSGINSEADRTITRLREIRSFIEEQSVPPRVLAGTDVVAEGIATLRDTQQSSGTGRLSLEAITARERDWQSLRDRISPWAADLDKRTKAIEERIVEIRGLRERWTSSLEIIKPDDSDGGEADPDPSPSPAVNTENVPPEVLARADEVIASLNELERLAADRRAEFLSVGVRISELETAIGVELATLRQERERELANIFSRDDVPLWQQFAELKDSDTDVNDTLTRQARELGVYASRNSGRFALHFVILAGLMMFLFWVRRKIEPLVADEPKLERPAAFFDMPVAAAMVLSLVFVSFIYIQPPRLLLTILSAAVIIPGILILRRIIEYPLSLFLYGLLGLYVADRVRDLMSDLTVISRTLFSIEMLAACAFLLWFYYSKRVGRSVEAGSRALFATVSKVVPVAIAVLGIAFAANLFGFVSLSFVIGNGVLRSGYAAILIYTFTQIVISGASFVLRAKPLSLLNSVRTSRMRIRLAFTEIIKWLGVLLWIVIALQSFSIQDFVYEILADILGYTFGVGEIELKIGDIVLFVLMIWVAVLISRFVRFVLEEDVFPRMDLGGGVSFAISSVIHYALVIAGFLIAIAAVGFELSRFALIAGAIGLGLGFGLQQIINNFVSGLILLFERPVKVGDTVQIGEHIGSLERIGLRASVVRKLDGSDVIVPNSQLISEEVINWTMSDERRRVDIPIGVAYGTDPKTVLDLLSSIPRGFDAIMTDPGPRALFLGFGDNSLDFELRFWVPTGDGWVDLRSKVVTEVHTAMINAGIEIPFPQRDLHIRSVDDVAAKLLAAKPSRGDEEDSPKGQL